MKEAKDYSNNGVGLTVINLNTITIEDLKQLVLDTYNDAYYETIKNLNKNDVSQRSELLVDFCKFHFMRFNLSNKEQAEERLINPYLKSTNCG